MSNLNSACVGPGSERISRIREFLLEAPSSPSPINVILNKLVAPAQRKLMKYGKQVRPAPAHKRPEAPCRFGPIVVRKRCAA